MRIKSPYGTVLCIRLYALLFTILMKETTDKKVFKHDIFEHDEKEEEDKKKTMRYRYFLKICLHQTFLSVLVGSGRCHRHRWTIATTVSSEEKKQRSVFPFIVSFDFNGNLDEKCAILNIIVVCVCVCVV